MIMIMIIIHVYLSLSIHIYIYIYIHTPRPLLSPLLSLPHLSSDVSDATFAVPVIYRPGSFPICTLPTLD